MKSYFALVDKDPDSAFGIRFPDIPGCFSAADVAEDIVPNAVEALQLWAEDMPVPEPSSHEAIVALPDIRSALAEGGYLISVPLIDNDSAVVRANVTFERGVLRAIDAAARERGLTRSAFQRSSQGNRGKTLRRTRNMGAGRCGKIIPFKQVSVFTYLS